MDEEYIYAFANETDVCVIVRNAGIFYWNSLTATNQVWHDEYKTMEEAIEGVCNVAEYTDRKYSDMQEFADVREFLQWSLTILKPR